MPPEPDRELATLLDIDRFAGRAIEFVSGMTREQFAADPKSQAAVMHELMVIGEAVRRLSDWTKTTHPEIPWARIARMRNILIHQYDAVDLEAVWKVATEFAPELRKQIAPLLPPPT